MFFTQLLLASCLEGGEGKGGGGGGFGVCIYG